MNFLSSSGPIEQSSDLGSIFLNSLSFNFGPIEQFSDLGSTE